MPLPVESLTNESPMTSIRQAINKTVAMCIKEGKEPKQCAAMAYEVARKQTGKDLSEGSAR